MRTIIISNIDLLSIDEEAELTGTLYDLNLEFETIKHNVKTKHELTELDGAILCFEINTIYEACTNLGHSCDWELFEDELKSYSFEDKQVLLRELVDVWGNEEEVKP